MAEYLSLDILTPDGRVDLHLAEGAASRPGERAGEKGPIEVEEVQVPAALGEIGVRPRHIPFLTPLVPGVVHFRYEGADRRMAVGTGFVEISEAGTVTLLTARAVRSWEVDVDEARKEREEIDAELQQHAKAGIDDPTVLKLQARREWIDAQLRAAQG